MNILQILRERTIEAMAAIGAPQDSSPGVTKSTKPQFGDYQINGSMSAAKKLKVNPRELAQKLVDELKLDGIAEKIELAGPGFINIHLNSEYIAQHLLTASRDNKLGVTQLERPKKVVVDYSSPNLAKEMHVGHIRSSVIGDSIARCLEFRGVEVIRQNHVGDWGTQFGMLIAYLDDVFKQSQDVTAMPLSDLENFYREAKQRFDDDADFASKARDYVVALQSGDEHCKKLWKMFIDTSTQAAQAVYEKLNVTLKPEHIKAESAYNDRLEGVVNTLKEKGIATENQGAQIVTLDELANKNGDPSIFIVQKSNGGYLYATTDLAACDYRSNELNVDCILVFVDARQKLHFSQVELTARKAGFLKDSTSLEACTFGTIMGEDGKPFKTRTGGTVKLIDLLDEAVNRAKVKVQERAIDLSEEELAEISHKVGIGAVRYFELSKNRTSDYIFNWDSMLSFEGSTAPYLQYAYTRIRSILRKSGVQDPTQVNELLLVEEKEKSLALKVLQFEEVLDQMIQEAMPHILCNYLYELASQYMSFYEACPILNNSSRLLLSHLVAETLALGLNILGIEVMEKM
ncbi:arginine--tRNA ligase [Pseudoalteromonas sp. JBTF-M23]|uniref:Arginine--tRNA ligase n=1 Tax=Pseudoalteromonas caenipelagi TaxID=2726988 RepID=A0A849VIZ3_9GAMM|nr:arginine--tRNA ligase [Pseudoalteromonas caenipelagi]NOU52628.1 arginine--tRNA ligase [Pseudoalteromonas caenipelagi]